MRVRDASGSRRGDRGRQTPADAAPGGGAALAGAEPAAPPRGPRHDASFFAPIQATQDALATARREPGPNRDGAPRPNTGGRLFREKRARAGDHQAVKGMLASTAVALLLPLLLAGCGASHGTRGAVPGPPGGRSEAEASEAGPQRTQAGPSCANRPRPFAHLVTAALIPDSVKAGGSFVHRIVYTLCGADDAPVSGRLRTRILRGPATVLDDAVPDYRLAPGRWTVDATVKVPPSAPEGPYEVVVDFAGNAVGEDFVGPVTFVRAVGLNVGR